MKRYQPVILLAAAVACSAFAAPNSRSEGITREFRSPQTAESPRVRTFTKRGRRQPENTRLETRSLEAPEAESTEAESSPYTVYWVVGGRIDGRTAEIPIDFRGAPISRHAIFLISAKVGLFPHEGPHVLISDPDYMRRHLERIDDSVARWVPEGFDGPVAIDYENWYLNAERTKNWPSDAPPDAHDRDYFDDMEEALMRYQPHILARARTRAERDQIIAEEYERLAREFYTQTIRRCKQVRPEAIWGFYGYPRKKYASSETPRGVIGYGDHDNEASRINDKLAWLVEESDALFPSIYPLYQSVDLPRSQLDRSYQNLPENDREYVTSNVKEALRMANGKPVFPFANIQYQNRHPALQRPNNLLNETNMTNQVAMPKVAGAPGVMIWGSVRSRDEIRRLQRMMDDVIQHVAREVVEPQANEPTR